MGLNPGYHLKYFLLYEPSAQCFWYYNISLHFFLTHKRVVSASATSSAVVWKRVFAILVLVSVRSDRYFWWKSLVKLFNIGKNIHPYQGSLLQGIDNWLRKVVIGHVTCSGRNHASTACHATYYNLPYNWLGAARSVYIQGQNQSLILQHTRFWSIGNFKKIQCKNFVQLWNHK